jgi:hypothetical protein
MKASGGTLFVLQAVGQQGQTRRQQNRTRQRPLSKIESTLKMDPEFERMVAQAQARQAAGQARPDATTPDKLVKVYRSQLLYAEVNAHSGEVIHISSLALLKVINFLQVCYDLIAVSRCLNMAELEYQWKSWVSCSGNLWTSTLSK